jgi:hypothetical protein
MIRLDDIGVDEVGDELGFADEVFDELCLVGVILPDDFDGDALDELAGAVLFGFIHDAHAAFKNFADNFVPKVVLNREQGHGPIFAKRVLKSSFAFGKGLQKPLHLHDFFFIFYLHAESEGL